MDQIQTPEGYLVGNSPEAQQRYKNSLELAKHGLKPILNPPFVNMPIQQQKDGYKYNVILDNKHINNVTFMSLEPNTTIEKHYHKENYHYILVTKGALSYYESPALVYKNVYLDRVNAGRLLYIAPMMAHQLSCEEKTDFYMFSSRGLTDELLEKDTYQLSFDLVNLPITARPIIETQFIKRH